MLIGLGLFAQEPIILSDSILPSTKGYEQDPILLVNKLTKGKDTDKEKFDAIFTWVTKNISYDYYSYLAPKGASMPDIKKILKYKVGICIDYAFLMDTLCELAGIQSVSVYGYAKDDLFDVNDSIYMDNHAWNAVKLNNLWYVYDVTWSSGVYKWEYTKFSKRVVRWENKIFSKSKLKTLSFQLKSEDGCFNNNDVLVQTYYHLSCINRFLLKLLGKVKLKTRHVFIKVARPDFYLSNPEVFAVTHFPDNPYWSLTSSKESIREFETDSAYYHLNDSLYIKQIRYGRPCSDCDTYFTLEEMDKQKQIKKNGFNFNKRNRFITWLSNYNIAELFYNKSLPETDSLTKVSLIDSTLTYYANAKNDLYQCISNVETSYNLQETKNKTKDNILYLQNRVHLDFMRSITNTTHESTRKIDYFSKQPPSRVREFKRKKKRLSLIYGDINVKTRNFKSKEKIKELEDKTKSINRSIDTITLELNKLQNNYYALIDLVSNNIWKKIKDNDSLNVPFKKGTNYRYLYLMDNYKKPIVEERKRIDSLKNQYKSNLINDIFTPSDSCADLGFRIIHLIEKRNNFLLEAAKLNKILVAEGFFKEDSVKLYEQLALKKMQENICWISGGTSKLNSVISGYKKLVEKVIEIESAIKRESKVEFGRYNYISKEINRRKRKFRSVPFHNLKITNKRNNLVQKYKRTYLSYLKKERQKLAKKKNK